MHRHNVCGIRTSEAERSLRDERFSQHSPNWFNEQMVKASWKRYDHKRHPTFHEYAAFVKKVAFLATSNTTSIDALTKASKNPGKKKPATTKSSTTLNTTAGLSSRSSYSASKPAQTSSYSAGKPAQTSSYSTSKPTQSSAKSPKKICHSCKSQDSHNTSDCRKFAKLPRPQQQEVIKSENLCFHCLRKGHSKDKCYVKVKCTRCDGDHATCHHIEKKTSESADNASSTEAAVTHSISSENGLGLTITTMILPVYASSLENPEQEILVYAPIDSMSDTSFICTDTADSLNAASSPTTLKMSTMTSRNQIVKCRKYLQLRVRGMNSKTSILIPQIFSQACIPGNRSHIPTPETAKQ
jgi:hypothetical protein